MALLTCRRCGLEIELRGSFLRNRNCPRCLADNATATPMTLSSAPVVDWGSTLEQRYPDGHDAIGAKPAR
jgi:hypothetical protein